jgi:hypothetical protein
MKITSSDKSKEPLLNLLENNRPGKLLGEWPIYRSPLIFLLLFCLPRRAQRIPGYQNKKKNTSKIVMRISSFSLQNLQTKKPF